MCNPPARTNATHTGNTAARGTNIIQPTSKSSINDLDCNCHELQAEVADGVARATGADGVVVCQINVKHQLPFHGLEHALSDGQVLGRRHGAHGPDVNLVGLEVLDRLLHLRLVPEALVTAVQLVRAHWLGKAELTTHKEVVLHPNSFAVGIVAVRKPTVHFVEREEVA